MPTILPTANPTTVFNNTASFAPFSTPTPVPTPNPSPASITADPTSSKPTSHPSALPTFAVTNATFLPTPHPTEAPTAQHTTNSTTTKTHAPTGQPTRQPSLTPSRRPTSKPTSARTAKSLEPSHAKDPTGQPSGMPAQTIAPMHKSGAPTGQPSRHVGKTLAPTGQPSSQPLSQPSYQPSTRPTAKATNSTPPTAHPSSAPSPPPPSALPSWSLPPTPAPSVSLQPTLNTSYYAYIVLEAGASLPVVLNGEARYVTPPPPIFGLYGAPSSPSSTRERELAARHWYLSVDVWSTGFGSVDQQQFVTVFAGWPNSIFDAAAINSTMAPVVASCAPGPKCNNQWVRCSAGTNIDITRLISPDGGGSLAITSVSSGITSVPAGCERNEIAKKYVVYMRYTLTPDHPQPTAAPSFAAAPTQPAITAVGVLAAFTHAGGALLFFLPSLLLSAIPFSLPP